MRAFSANAAGTGTTRSPAWVSDIGNPPRWDFESRSAVACEATGIEIAQVLARPSGDEIDHRLGGRRSEQDPVAEMSRGRDHRAGGETDEREPVGGAGPQSRPLIRTARRGSRPPPSSPRVPDRRAR